MRITLQGALGDAEASGGCDKKGGSPHLGHLLSFLCVFFFLSSARSLSLVVVKAAPHTAVHAEFSVATVVLPVWPQQKFDNIV